MTLKNYKIWRLAIMVILAASISFSINLNNYYLPIIFMVSAMAVMYYLRQQLKTDKVVADERDYQVAGNAARYTIFIYGILGAIGTFVLMAVSGKDGIMYVLSQYLAYSVCFLMLLNAFLFKYLIKKQK